jgi:hypothetical protein
MKNTQSSIGDEYSYRFFRHQHNEDLAAFEEAVQAMHQNAAWRQRMQFAFHRIGRKTNNGLLGLLLEPSQFPKLPMLLIVLVTLFDVVSLVWMWTEPGLGILAATLGFCVALILYSLWWSALPQPL